MLARIEPPQAGDIGLVLDGVLDGRPFALDEIEPDAHRLERQQQIGEQDRRVEFDAADGCSVTSVARSGVRQSSSSE